MNRVELDSKYGSLGEIGAMIKQGLTGLNMPGYEAPGLGARAVDELALFTQLLLSANEKMNLTGARDARTLVERHIVDSLALHRVLGPSRGFTILDVGTGAGLPGLPLSIVTEARVSLLDSLNKRIRFLTEVRDELGLTNVDLVCARAEDYIRKEEKRAAFDIVTSRAVAPLRLLLELCLPYLKKGAYFYSFKGRNYEDELLEARNALGQLHGELADVIAYDLGRDQSFYILKFRLLREVADIYPRRAGLPAKRPL